MPERFKKLSYYLSWGFVIVGIVVIAGWFTGIERLKTIAPNFITVKVNTAICFILSGVILLLQLKKNKKNSTEILVSIFAIIIFLAGTLTLLQYLLGLNFNIDEAFFKEGPNTVNTLYPGRQTPINALLFSLFGLSFFPFLRKIKRPIFNQIINLVIAIIAFMTFVTYLFSTDNSYKNYSYLIISFQSTWSFILLVLATLFLRPEEGIMKIISSKTVGGRLFRQIFPFCLLVFLLLGWLIFKGERAGIYISEFGTAIFIVSTVIIFTVLLFKTAVNLTGREYGQKQAEKSLRAGEEKFSKVFHSNNHAYAILDGERRYVDVNQSFENLIEFTRHELMGKTSAEAGMNNLEFLQRSGELVIKLLTEGKLENIETDLETKSGIAKTILISVHEITLDKVQHWLIALVCITEIRKAEKILKETEEKYKTLIEQASDAIFISDPLGKFLIVNNSTLKLTQMTESEILQMSYYDFLIEDDVQRHPLHLQELAEGKTVVTERLMKSKQGLPFNVEVTAKILTTGNLLVFVKDITERKKQQQLIIDSEQRLIRAENMGKLGHGFYDMVTDSMTLSAGLYKIFGVKPSDFSHTVEGLKSVIHVEDYNAMGNAIDVLFTNGEVEVEFRIAQPAGDIRNVLFKTVLTKNDAGEFINSFTTALDITEKQKVQQEIEIYNSQLQHLTNHLQTVREEERRRIGREIHDDLGQQLTAIKMDAAWIDKNTPEESGQMKGKLKNILTLLDGSNKSVRRILSELKPSILDEYGLCEAIELLAFQFTENTDVPVTMNCPEKKIQLSGEITTCIFRVFQESLTNITKYAQASMVTVSLIFSKSQLFLEINDNGIGFEKFTLQNKKSFGILGMQERVKALDGKFNLQSSPGKGTEIIISLPLKQGL